MNQVQSQLGNEQTRLQASRRRVGGQRRSLRSLRKVLACGVVAATTIAGGSGIVQAKADPPTPESTPMSVVADRIGSSSLVEQGITGAGIDVAVIDTGVEPVAGLDEPGKLLLGPDLSFEAGVTEWYGRDNYGHGTVMASIIAGKGGPDGFAGVAPDSRILSVKVADNTGAVDVSQVIAALDWVVQYGQSDGLNVRVINLSYATDSVQPYQVDPLAYAVEKAWKAGYVVVTAAGNGGSDTVGSPAKDPYVIAVGAADEGTEVAEFSNTGAKARRPDLLAPGTRILGLAAPQSRLVQEHPEAVVDGHYLRGNGTSQAAAVVSGAAALLLEQRPELTPDQVKALLIMGSVDNRADKADKAGKADKAVARLEAQIRKIFESSNSPARGRYSAGVVDVERSAALPKLDVEQQHPLSDGSGSLDAARGTDYVVMPDGTLLEGEVDFTGASWSGASWSGASWSGASWSGASWSGASWSGASWSGASWSGASWSGASWSGASWSGASWSGASWSSSVWSGASWSGASWSGASWSGASWSGAWWA